MMSNPGYLDAQTIDLAERLLIAAVPNYDMHNPSFDREIATMVENALEIAFLLRQRHTVWSEDYNETNPKDK